MRTPLFDIHQSLGARIVDYAGWEMPVQYSGVIAEHQAVRRTAGLFDVSHMGEVLFEGPDAVDVVNRLVTNDVRKPAAGRAVYTAICNADGGILDDAICYKLTDDRVLIVVNAANTAKMIAHFEERADGQARPRNVSDQWALLAIQGPKAREIACAVIPEAEKVRPFRVAEAGDLMVAGTGYTGEPGFELFVPAGQAAGLWDRLMDAGQAPGLAPAGLGARDTLRLEMTYSLYGNDIDETTNPLEAGLGWVVKLDKPGGFIGQEALRRVREAGTTRKLVGLKVTGRGIARHGYDVYRPGGDTRAGRVTSGTKSPSLGEAIAMAYLDRPHDALGTEVEVDIRGRRVPAQVVETPFYNPNQG